jgi:hypothetical protein
VSLKSAFTRNADWLDASSTLYADGPTRVRRAAIEDGLQKLMHSGVQKSQRRLQRERLPVEFNATVHRYGRGYARTMEAVLAAMGDAEATEAAAEARHAPIQQGSNRGAAAEAAAAAAAAAHGGHNQEVDMALRPKPLTKEYTICKLRHWEDQFTYRYQAKHSSKWVRIQGGYAPFV